VTTHVVPRIGSIPLHKLQPEDRDTFYAHLLRNGRPNGAARTRVSKAWTLATSSNGAADTALPSSLRSARTVW
jgi:hypothetical protein